MREVTQAIASFERTLVFGDSPYDRYAFGDDPKAMSEAAVRGLQVFLGQGRCVSCHVIEQTQALFTDNRFHNIGVGINRVQDDIPRLTGEFLKARAGGVRVDERVLMDAHASELGRFAVTAQFDDLGAFKTPTLRNVAVTAPYMHDGSLKTLRDVIMHYNLGGLSPGDPAVNAFLSGGIRPLDLTSEQIDDLVAFLEALTSPRFARADTAQR
jgi:cytochrome c peroxidase